MCYKNFQDRGTVFSEEQHETSDGILEEKNNNLDVDFNIPPPPEESPRDVLNKNNDNSEVPSRSPTNRLSQQSISQNGKYKRTTKLSLEHEFIPAVDSPTLDDELIDDIKNSINNVKFNKSVFTQTSRLRFRPSNLVYKDSSVSIPSVSDFHIDNTWQSDVFIYSVESPDPQFHPVMFQPQMLPYNSTITIPLLFLPYYPIATMVNITITTSEGAFFYEVEGYSKPNPYRMTPIVGITVTAGTSPDHKFDMPINIHNPFKDVLYVREVLTTEDFLTLGGVNLQRGGLGSLNNDSDTQQLNPHLLRPELSDLVPHFHSDAESSAFTDSLMWSIPQNENRILFLLRISTELEPGDYHGFVHVKTDRDNMVLPVEFKVVSGGIFAVPDVIDFGTLSSVSERMDLDLWLVNTCAEDLEVINIEPSEPDPQLEILLYAQPIVVFGGTNKQYSVAHLVYTADKPGKFSNTLLVFTNNSNPALAVIEIAYTVTVYHGAISLDDESSIFIVPIQNISYFSTTNRKDGTISYKNLHQTKKGKSDEAATLMKNIIVFKNYFDVPVSLQSVYVVNNCLELFTFVSDFGDGSHANQLEYWQPIDLYFNYTYFSGLILNKSATLPKSCILDIHTNISNHRYPIYIMDGALAVSFVDAHMIEDYKEINRIEQEYDLNNRMSFNNRNTKSSKNSTLSINSDTYHIDMGNISVFEPRQIKFALSNSNPTRIQFNLSYASENTCLCHESSFPMGYKDEDAAQRAMDTANSASYQESLNTARCVCFTRNTDSVEEERIIDGVKPVYHFLYTLSFNNLLNKSKVNITHGQKNFIRVELSSIYQKIILFLHFRVVKSKLRSKLLLGNKPNAKQFVFGKNNSFRMYTKSRFRQSLDDLTFNMHGFPYELFDLKLSQEGGEAKFSYTIEPVIFTPSSHLYTLNPSWQFNLWSCIHYALEDTDNLLIDYHKIKFDSYLEDLHESTVSSQSNITTKIKAFDTKNKFKAIWKIYYRNGLKMSPAYTTVKNSITYHNYKLENFTVQSPTEFMPDEYRILLPTTTVGQVVWFYMEIYNPFSFPVEFQVFQHSNEKYNPPNLKITNFLKNFDVKSSHGTSVTSVSALPLYDCDYTSGDNYVVETVCRDEPIEDNSNSFEIIRGISFYRKSKNSALVHFQVNESKKTSPFMMSKEGLKSLIPSNAVGKLGPIFFFPTEESPDIINAGHFFVHNNFSGYDKVKVIGVSGVSKFIVDGVYSKNSYRLAKLNAANDYWEVEDIDVKKLGERFTISIKNIGDVGAVVQSFAINEKNCNSEKAISLFNSKTDLVSQCENLPREITKGQTFNISIVSPQTCAYSYFQYKVNIYFENDEPIVSKSLKDESFKVLLKFKFSPQLIFECHQPNEIISFYFVKILVSFIAVMVIFQVVLLVRRMRVVKSVTKEPSGVLSVDKFCDNHIDSILTEKQNIIRKHIPIILPDIFRSLSSSGIDLNDVTTSFVSDPTGTKKEMSKLKYVDAVLHKRKLNISSDIKYDNQEIKPTNESDKVSSTTQYESPDPNVTGEDDSFTEIKSKSKQTGKSANKTSNIKKNAIAVNLSGKSDNSDTSLEDNFSSARTTPTNIPIPIVVTFSSPVVVNENENEKEIIKKTKEVSPSVKEEKEKDKSVNEDVKEEKELKEDSKPEISNNEVNKPIRKESFDNSTKQKSTIAVKPITVTSVTTKVSPSSTTVKTTKSPTAISTTTTTTNQFVTKVAVQETGQPSSTVSNATNNSSNMITSKEITRSGASSVTTTIAKRAIFNAINQATKEKPSIVVMKEESVLKPITMTEIPETNISGGFISSTSSTNTLDNFLEQFTDKSHKNNTSGEKEKFSIAFPDPSVEPEPFNSTDSNDSPLFYYQNDLLNSNDKNIITSPVSNEKTENNFFSWAQSSNDSYLLQPSSDPIFIAPNSSHDDLLFFDPINNDLNGENKPMKNNFTSGFDNLLRGLDVHSLGDFGGLGFGAGTTLNSNSNAEEEMLNSIFSDFSNSVDFSTSASNNPVGFNSKASSFVPEFPPGFSPTKLQSNSLQSSTLESNSLQSTSFDNPSNLGTNPRAPSFHPMNPPSSYDYERAATINKPLDSASFYSAKDKQFVKVNSENIYHDDFLEAQAWINDLSDEEVEEELPYVKTSYYNSTTRKFDTIQTYQIEQRQIPQQHNQPLLTHLPQQQPQTGSKRGGGVGTATSRSRMYYNWVKSQRSNNINNNNK